MMAMSGQRCAKPLQALCHINLCCQFGEELQLMLSVWGGVDEREGQFRGDGTPETEKGGDAGN